MQRKWIVTLIVCAGVFMASLDLFIVNIAFPSIERSFHHASLGSLSWIFSGYAIVFAALLVPAGRWADAFGRKRAFLLGLAIFVLASVGCAVSPSIGWLIAARVVQAAGGALMLPTSLGLILPEFAPHERHSAIGAWAATGAIAAATGPPLGGLLVQADWRLVFLVNVPVGLLGLVFGARILSERREVGAHRPDLLGALTFIVAIGALVVAIVNGQDLGWASPRVMGLLVLTAILLPVIWWRSERPPSPLFEPAMLRVRSFSLALTASILFFAGFAAMLLSGVLFLTTVWHEDVLTAGLMLFPRPAGGGDLQRPLGAAGGRRRLPAPPPPPAAGAAGRLTAGLMLFPRPAGGGDLQRPLGAAGRPLRLPAPGPRRVAAVRGRIGLVDHPDRGHPRLPDPVPAGDGLQRRRRGPD